MKYARIRLAAVCQIKSGIPQCLRFANINAADDMAPVIMHCVNYEFRIISEIINRFTISPSIM